MKALIWLLGIAAALGVYLAGVSSPVIRGIGIIVFLIGAASIFFIFYYLKRYQKAVYLLQQQIMDFLEGRIKTPKFSVNDDLFALLENAVVELENRLLLERHQAVLAGKKNADFITDVSHQLKTPLAALKLYCEMDQSKNLGAHTQKQLVLIIEDNGGGIAETELPKLFQRFYRSTQTMVGGGAGLGLAITKTIVEKHHGTIYAENTAQGLRMTICFPLLDGVLSIG
ncbi:MAG: hypothetical protein GX922_00030 [Firmicutes bacterium]|nr:hypothetical protein [Bacillota bacterium]